MRLALILGTLSALLCLASGLSQSDPSSSKGNGFPKKVTTLKKRPTKTPTTAPISSSSRETTTKPSKPRVKIVKSAGPSSTRSTTKVPAALTETFGNLPADDLEFIKELDKQFKLHGDKIKIKVERDNSTSASAGGKNSKRTIDGDLGYGYSHAGYDYTPPKFMFYPYSQHDIPSGFAHPQPLPEEQEEEPQQPAQQHHQHPSHEQVTSVTIEPSYSYELKPQTSYETHQSPAQHTGPEQPQIDLPQDEAKGSGGGASAGYQEPVIVLRIPGPAKYAAHLQTLLQQYLEIRAAQYLSLLQEAEQQQQQQHHQQHVDPQPQYGPPEPAQYHQEVSYAHQLAPTPAPLQYAPIDDVYQSYKGRHQQQLQLQQQQQQYEPQQYYAPMMDYQQPTQFYYAQPQSHLQQQPQLYLIAMAQPEPEPLQQQHMHHQQQQQHHHQQQHQQPIYVPESDPPTGPEGPEQETEPEHSLPITENNPRPTHTKVIFNPYPYQQQQQQHQQHHQHEQHLQAEEQQHSDLEVEQQQQQSEGERPFNYHAHGLKMRPGKRATKPEPLEQIREYVREKLGAEMGSAVEYKTTQLLEG
ncbi:activating signal cointegrator 1 complex subunit 2 homolog [Drosophila gunungcola]|uniref:Uncharacterized protein n=1 Tax=Drosophila gunungcola TaxID=103775 RepID=A0A9P9YBF2_9MUSC|nr:activating signal cointegrator 1 complex subunit 2 homolog [Drosophila gunungcola]KAI8033856.1 hypothetical protein M5D96_013380 [Drosophila gunungcola]